jgi:AAA15 family ATPase/GTPase
MILEVRLQNFFSIREQVTLSMYAGGSKSQKTAELQGNTVRVGKDTILKSAAIYGSNASGKSNILKAIDFGRDMVLSSHSYNDNTIFAFEPFKLDSYANAPSIFFISFVTSGIRYDYSFSLTKTAILTEELYSYPNGRKVKIFTRNEQAGAEKRDKYSFGHKITKPMDVARNTSNKTLYISRASQMDREIAREIFKFFSNIIVVIPDIYLMSLRTDIIDGLLAENKNEVLRIMQQADSDIIDVGTTKEKINMPSFQLVENDSFKVISEVRDVIIITTRHCTNKNVAFNMQTEESQGTKILFILLLLMMDVIKKDGVILVDELDSSLHNALLRYLIQLFHSSDKGQIVFSTHNTNLLDMDVFRKDQIYFVSKRDNGSSELYSLYDYKDFRDTMDLEKAYLNGRFDAIPKINASKNAINEVLNG